ncbi:MAG: DedA family protein [Propionibacteriales bacterium]|nr:DedA family protein [Propionibacteriales bacterium]
MQTVVNAIQSLPPTAAYALIAALVFGEAAIFIGFVLPGETAVVLGGFLASTGDLNVAALSLLVFVSAVVGDSIGYEVGKHFGPRVIALGVFRRHEVRLGNAQRVLRERGGPAVLAGRFTAFFRAVMPGLAGLSQMRYGTFLFWNALGGLVWGVGFTLVGYFAGESYDTVAATVGRGTAIVILVIAIALVVTWQVRRRRRERLEEDTREASPET